jgi:hypothetical protein
MERPGWFRIITPKDKEQDERLDALDAYIGIDTSGNTVTTYVKGLYDYIVPQKGIITVTRVELVDTILYIDVTYVPGNRRLSEDLMIYFKSGLTIWQPHIYKIPISKTQTLVLNGYDFIGRTFEIHGVTYSY